MQNPQIRTRLQAIMSLPDTVSKVVLWVLVALYTFLLPDAIIAYRDIVAAFGKVVAGKVPLVIVLVAGAAYTLAVILSHRSLKNLLFLVPSAIIAVLIMRLVDNPNKHIHIPEYVVMAWLLFAVISKDYKGKGLFILIFFYGTMLGVVDEIEQGINPARFYGLSDMMVNSASVLIGVFTIMGLVKVTAANWAWTSHLKEHKALIALAVFGITGIVITCAYLFRVQADGKFWGVYPLWLLIWNVLYMISALVIAVYQGVLYKMRQSAKDDHKDALPPEARTALLWLLPLLINLFYMHSLVIYLAMSGAKFI
jgi:VanZ family protein